MLSETLLSQRLSVLLPLIVLPLELSPTNLRGTGSSSCPEIERYGSGM